MTQNDMFIKKIFQRDNFTFTIEWNDGLVQNFRLSLLQKHCPCALCHEKKSKMSESASKRCNLDEEGFEGGVRARRIFSVGRYALQIDFTRGCSNGIFNYDSLRELGEAYK